MRAVKVDDFDPFADQQRELSREGRRTRSCAGFLPESLRTRKRLFDARPPRRRDGLHGPESAVVEDDD